MKTIRFHAPEKLSPTVQEIVKAAKQEVFGDEPVRFEAVEPDPGVLCMGVDAPGAIRTLSPAQIATSASAVSALVEALTLCRDGSTLPGPSIEHVPAGMEWVYIDKIEQYFDQPAVFDIENAPDGSLLSIAITGGGRCAVFTSHFQYVAQALSKCYYLVAHNGKYDQGVIRRQFGVRVPIWFDTMLARYTLHPSAQGHYGLKELAQRVLGLPDYEADIKQYTGRAKDADYSKIPTGKLVEYNGWDVYATWHLFKRMLPLVQDEPAFWLAMRAASMLGDVEHTGFTIDVPYVRELSAQFEQERQEALALLPEGVNPASPKQLKELFASRGVNVQSTNAATLDELADDERLEGIIEPLLAFRKASKMRSTYCEALLSAEQGGIVRTTFNVHGTSTGRLSSSKPFNAQNQPRDTRLRNMFIGRNPDHVFVNADYKNAELRTMSVLSGDKKMQEFFQPGMPDYFDSVMPVAFPDNFADINEFHAFKASDPHEAKEMRTLLKTVVFGLAFGRQAPAIAKALKVSTKYAQQIIDNYLVGLPDFADWRRRVTEAALDQNKRDLLTTVFGRRFESEVVTHRNRQNVINAALAFLPQSTASDLCLTSAIRVNHKLQQEGTDAAIVGLVHDAIMLTAHCDVAQDVCDLVSAEMTNTAAEYLGEDVPFMVDAGYAERWGGVE